MNEVLPKRVLLTLGEIKRIGIFEEFCDSEKFDKRGIITGVSDDAMFSIKSKLLPDGWVVAET